MEAFKGNVSAEVAPTLRVLSTVRQFSTRYPAFPEGGLRSLIFLADANGLRCALIRIGRKVLIDEEKFFRWLDQRQQ